jgi:alpha-N-arabinofuranosidase
MRKSTFPFLAAILCVPPLAAAALPAAHAPRPIVASIDTRQVSRPISPYAYGMFIEHIGSPVYRSLWSEMLDDRKFYSQISSQAAPARAGRASE